MSESCRMMMMRAPRVHAAAALLAAALLAGCGGLRSDVEPDRLYVLAAEAGAEAPPPLPGLLVVPRPTVQPGLDTARIALTRAGNELDFYARSRWSGPLPQVLGAFVVQSLDGAFATVTGTERSAGPADYELQLTVRHFEAVYGAQDGAPEVRVALDCLLVATAPRRVLGSCDADVRAPAAGNRMAAIVAAFEVAAHGALAQVRARATQIASAAAATRQP